MPIPSLTMKKIVLILHLFLLIGCTNPEAITEPVVEPSDEQNTPIVFSPSSVSNLHTWYDSTDLSTITLNGSNVTEWKSKSSPQNSFIQANTTKQPQLINNQITFDGANDEMAATISEAIGSDITLIYVIKLSAYEARIPFSFRNPTYNGNGPDISFYKSKLNWNTGDGATNYFSNSTLPSVLDQFHIFLVKNDSVKNTAEVFVDGISQGTAVYKKTSITDFSTTRLTIGNWTSGNFYMNGQFGELLIFNKLISASEQSEI